MPIMRSASRSLAMALLIACTACAAQTANPSAPRQDRNVMTGEQIVAGQYLTAYDALEALHPSWLRARGRDSMNNPSEVLVYLDNVKLGNVEALRSIEGRSISYIRFYDAASANTRWGVGHGAGVVFVSTKP